MRLNESLTNELKQTTTLIEEINWDAPEVYADWLSQTYHFVRHTTRLLALAAGVASLDQQSYHQQFLYHLKEEYGHEKIALADLKALGLPLRAERPQTQRFYHTTRTLIQSHGPVGLFGYMHFLEALAVHMGPAAYEKVRRTFGSKCGRFLAVHGEEDIKHVEETLKTLADCAEEDMDTILDGLRLAGEQYRSLLAAIIQDYRPKLQAA
ncbi:MAG: iron-containing redox enzyme family protein [Bdellovibrionaceae bacterium]|nr:iron-containing redox enzyme family protein [Bdellovibrionales bacterium]MCB9083564.1 iron-containing redox enzyme family protein [Pseudobdellovibrionaceae bacterium]